MRDSIAPISPFLLERICEQWVLWYRDEYERALFNVASLIAFLCTCRISELAAGGKADKSKLALQWQDVKVLDGRVELSIR